MRQTILSVFIFLLLQTAPLKNFIQKAPAQDSLLRHRNTQNRLKPFRIS